MRLAALLALAWLLCSAISNLNALYLPSALGLAGEFFRLVSDGSLLFHIAATLSRAAMGLLIGALIGLPLGYAMVRFDWLRGETLWLLDAMRSTPSSMLFPLVLVVLGFGEGAKWAIAAYISAPILALSIASGAELTEQNRGKIEFLSLNRRHLSLRDDVLATLFIASPAAVLAAKAALSLSLVVVVVAEMFFVAESGLGWLAYRSYQTLDIDRYYLCVLMAAAVGSGLNVGFDALLRRSRRFTGQ